jgi:hypothetical protein
MSSLFGVQLVLGREAAPLLSTEQLTSTDKVALQRYRHLATDIYLLPQL